MARVLSSPVAMWPPGCCLLAPACGPTRSEVDFLAHLQAVVATSPLAQRWHFVCDQLNTHQSASLVRWVADLSGMEADLGVKGERGILASRTSRAALSSRPDTQGLLSLQAPSTVPGSSSLLHRCDLCQNLLRRSLATEAAHGLEGVLLLF